MTPEKKVTVQRLQMKNKGYRLQMGYRSKNDNCNLAMLCFLNLITEKVTGLQLKRGGSETLEKGPKRAKNTQKEGVYKKYSGIGKNCNLLPLSLAQGISA